MSLSRSVTAALLSMTVPFGLGFAVPAVADDVISENAFGLYEVEMFGKKQSIWVSTACDDGASQCIKVTEFALEDLQRMSPVWTANAYWSVGSWIMQPLSDTRQCKDGSEYQVTIRYSWDAAKNKGWRAIRDPGVCEGAKAKQGANGFKLHKTEANASR